MRLWINCLLILLFIPTLATAGTAILRPCGAPAAPVTDNSCIAGDEYDSTSNIHFRPQDISDYVYSRINGAIAPATHSHPLATTTTDGFLSATDKTALNANVTVSTATEGALGQWNWRSLAAEGYTVASTQAKWPYLSTPHKWASENSYVGGSFDGQAMRITSTNYDPYIHQAFEQTGTVNNGVLTIRYRRVSGSGWDGKIITSAFASNGNGVTITANLGTAPAVGVWTTATVDFNALNTTTWVGTYLYDIRVDMGANPDDVYDIDYITLNGTNITAARYPVTTEANLSTFGVDLAAFQNGVMKARLLKVPFIVLPGYYPISGTVLLDRVQIQGRLPATKNEAAAHIYATDHNYTVFNIIGGQSSVRDIMINGNGKGFLTAIKIAPGVGGVYIKDCRIYTTEKGVNVESILALTSSGIEVTHNYFYLVDYPAKLTGRGGIKMLIEKNSGYNPGYLYADGRTMVHIDSTVSPYVDVIDNTADYFERFFYWDATGSPLLYMPKVNIRNNKYIGESGGSPSTITVISSATETVTIDISDNKLQTVHGWVSTSYFPNGNGLKIAPITLGYIYGGKVSGNYQYHSSGDLISLVNTVVKLTVTGNTMQFYGDEGTLNSLLPAGETASVCLHANYLNHSSAIRTYPDYGLKGFTNVCP